MRSKTLSSDLTILKKDLTRFAPAWLGLCAYLLLWGSVIMSNTNELGSYYEPVAPIFAPIFALLVFGYLCDPAECGMVHSLPVRRERLFFLHVISASLMFLLPTAVFCGVTGSITPQRALYRFLFICLEFLFLFSIGVLCMMLTGRKIGAALLYIFIQSFCYILWLLLENLYLPALPGVYLDEELLMMSPTLIVNRHCSFLYPKEILKEDLVFIGSILLASLVILIFSLTLYRRRKLEHAGDLLAVHWLNPLFAVCSGITGVSVMVVFGFDMELPVILIGCAAGYLSYWMLSKKTARVFTPKILGGQVCLLGALVGSLVLVRMDPLDRVHYVPEPEEVSQVSIGQFSYMENDFTTSDPSIIAQLGALHLELAEHYEQWDEKAEPYRYGENLYFTYELKNGKKLIREYCCDNEALLDRAAWYLSQPEAMFRSANPEFKYIGIFHHDVSVRFDQQRSAELIDILLNECREGRMFAYGYRVTEWAIEVVHQNTSWHTYVHIPEEAVDTIAWLEAYYSNNP